MSFIKTNAVTGKAYAPGFFHAHEECVRVTHQFATNSNLAVNTASGGKYIPMGTVYPENGNNAVGIVYEDVDVTYGDMPGSLVIGGKVWEGRLATSNVTNDAKSAMAGIEFLTEPTVNRPNWQ